MQFRVAEELLPDITDSQEAELTGKHESNCDITLANGMVTNNCPRNNSVQSWKLLEEM